MPHPTPERALFGDPEDNATIEPLIAARMNTAKRLRDILNAALTKVLFLHGPDAEQTVIDLNDAILNATPAAERVDEWACDMLAERRAAK